ncbi:MAG: hypothetical protein M3348_03710 [Acidobacteriota bacterium]|nr:hypothetical protein [Acidobacteriota bacterium]
MRKSELEAWVLNVIDRVESGQPYEDARVELKREWPEPKRAARRIAGHANAAGGEPVLWIIGVDQTVGVVGADALELAMWLPQVRAEFIELAPDLLLDLNVPARGKTVVALLFETDRAPFVVKNPAYGSSGGGSVEMEVPWRDGTRVRSARRSELLRMLAPPEMLPSIEVIEGSLKLRLPQEGEQGNSSWWIVLKLYVTPQIAPVYIPFHRCTGTVRVEGLEQEALLYEPKLYPASKIFGLHRAGRVAFHNSGRARPATIHEAHDELIIEGPGMMKLESKLSCTAALDTVPLNNARAVVHLLPANAERPRVVAAEFRYDGVKDQKHVWALV